MIVNIYVMAISSIYCEAFIVKCRVSALSIHPFSIAYPGLGRGGSKLSKVAHMSPLPDNILLLVLVDPKTFPGRMGTYSIIPGLIPWSPPTQTCLEHLLIQEGILTLRPSHNATPYNAKEQRFYPEFASDVRAPDPVP